MNVAGKISGIKKKFRARQTAKVQKTADSLADLKRERVRAEGQAKVLRIQQQEREKLKTAKSDLRKQKFENSILGKARKGMETVQGMTGSPKKTSGMFDLPKPDIGVGSSSKKKGKTKDKLDYFSIGK